MGTWNLIADLRGPADTWIKNALVAGADFNTVVTPGTYPMSTVPTDWVAQRMPANLRGTLTVSKISGTTQILQTYVTWANGYPATYTRSLVSGNWSAWSMAPSETLAGTANFNTVTAGGRYAFPNTATDWVGQNMPVNNLGVLEVIAMNSPIAFIQRYTTWEAAPRVFTRQYTSGGFGAWAQTGWTQPNITATTDFNTVTLPGLYALSVSPTNWVTQNMPVNSTGVLEVLNVFGTTARLQRFTTWEALPASSTPRIFARKYALGAWGAWTLVGGAADNPRPASGMKRVGVPITAGRSDADAPLTGSVRMPLLYQAPILRWRLRIQDINPRTATTRAGIVSFTGLWLATHAGAGAASAAPVQLTGAFTFDGATEYRSKWFNTPLAAGNEYLLSYGYSKATAPLLTMGYTYQTVNSADASATNPAGMTKLVDAPFTITIEADTYAHTPVVANFGDSNSIGVGASTGLHDSWLSHLCRSLKALPQHLGSSGDGVIGTLSEAAYKFTRFNGLTRPDAVIFAMGQNDAATNGATSAAIIPNINTTLANLAVVSDNLYAVNFLPRTTDPWTGFEAVRRELSTHLATQPGGIRDVFDIAAAISPDDETITPAYDADGIHLTTAGFAAAAVAITRPVTTPPVQYVAL